MEKKMFFKASHLIFEKAKHLRNNPTHAETILWGYLKRNPFGYKFRRQHPISIYIADFYCHALKLVIEIDGSVHSESNVATRDLERQKNLEAEGLTFLRITNEIVERQLETAIAKIEEYIINKKNENKDPNF